ncbi:MAG TPA: formyltransferase family protein [Acidobacteriota bacterium]|nr:formyltransferase family protein [Acidobacteriota bacterium]
MNVILVTHDSIYGRCLAARLFDTGCLDRVIIETGRPSRKFYWRKLKSAGPVNFLFGYLLNRWFERQGRKSLPDLPMPRHEKVENINTCLFADDDLVVGFGTSYITARTLKRIKNGFLNLHTGILPDYRGVKSEFWTLFCRDYDRAGWTLHFMTPKLDAGDIVLQHFTPVHDENPAQLRAKMLTEGIGALAAFIQAVRRDGIESISRRPQGEGRYFTTPTWREWRDYRQGKTPQRHDRPQPGAEA